MILTAFLGFSKQFSALSVISNAISWLPFRVAGHALRPRVHLHTVSSAVYFGLAMLLVSFVIYGLLFACLMYGYSRLRKQIEQ